eukprot:TRINITY_DN22984_c0_g1_i1.p3 TRINITY_DN22984_c0_g1~~TRINITY_DN22984_c0_g1_i1.p3  ORF type:complete len:52 (+),score=1.29 TRINITY_DN22984_c0_g1_i1:307-462(+)
MFAGPKGQCGVAREVSAGGVSPLPEIDHFIVVDVVVRVAGIKHECSAKLLI